MASYKVKDELTHFAESTTFHGIPNAATEKRHECLRLFWTLAFLTMLGIYLTFLSQTLIKFYSYPVVTNVEYLTTNELDFPSVTICNSNFARFSVVSASEELKFIFQAPGFDPDYEMDMSQVDIASISQIIAHQPSDTYLECAFDGRHKTPCDVENKVVWTRSPDGYCHTFNAQPAITGYGKIVTTRPGEDYGLFLLINIEQYEYSQTLTNASGIQVVVHDQDTLPAMKEKGFLVSPGTETLVALKKTVVKRLPEPYAKAPNLCLDTTGSKHENPLKYFPMYSLSACRRECRIKHQLKSCNCSGHIYGGVNVTVCNFEDYAFCSRPAREVYDSDPSLIEACGCLTPCEETIYDVSVTSAQMPSDFQRERLVNSLNIPEITTENVEKNIIALKIFFGEMRYTMIEQQAQYSPTSLFGELGGQLGLCLGASVLTMCELLQLIVTMCAGILARSRDRNKIIVVEEVKQPQVVTKEAFSEKGKGNNL